MFAFAVWDTRARRLLLARDRVGIKPLYYAQPAEGGLVFGSEIKSILQDPAVDRRMEPRSARCLPDAALRAGSGDDLRAGAEAARRAMCSWPSAARCASHQVLGSRVHRQRRSGQRAAVSRGAGRASDRVGPDAAHQRGAARRVPLRRHRFLDRCRLHDGDERRSKFSRPRWASPTRRTTSSTRPSGLPIISVAASRPRWSRRASTSSCLAWRGISTSRSAIPRRFPPTASPPPRVSA